jgi:hypothetical protein
MLSNNKITISIIFTFIVLLIISLVIVSIDNVKDFDTGTPERTVQLFLQHMTDKEFDQSYKLVSEGKKANCSLVTFLSSASRYDNTSGNIISHKETLTYDKIAIVTIYVTNIEASPLGVSDHSFQEVFTLISTETQTDFMEPWVITEFQYPFNCVNPK